MVTLDTLDRDIIAALSEDGRAPVSGLAEQFGVARGTLQARIDRLLSTGVIRRFTIETCPDAQESVISAICCIQLRAIPTRAVQRRLREIDEVHEIHTTNGEWDVVVALRAERLEQLDDALAAIRGIPGVDNTQTSILLRPL